YLARNKEPTGSEPWTRIPMQELNICTTLPGPGALPARREGQLRRRLAARWLKQPARTSAGKQSSQEIAPTCRLSTPRVVTFGCTERVPCRRGWARAAYYRGRWAVS